MKPRHLLLLVLVLSALAPAPAHAWSQPGHRLIETAALRLADLLNKALDGSRGSARGP